MGPPLRKILHLDMDAFYASVEQRDRPELRGRPVAVGGSPEGRGVVCAASYEARPFGVRSAMNASKAARLCPHLTFVPPRFPVYRDVSRQVFAILRSVTPLVEPLSIDEAFLDVTENRLGEPSATRVAQHLRARIQAELSLTASVGVSHLKFVAKIASSAQKPDGLTVVDPRRVLDFLHPLPVGRLWGVGPKAEERLRRLGLSHIGDVAQADVALLSAELGSHGRALWRMARGDWHRPVVPNRRRKSFGAEQTFDTDVADAAVVIDRLRQQAERVCGSVAQRQRVARTITLKVRYADFSTLSRSQTLATPTADPAVVCQTLLDLLGKTEVGARPVRLVGVALSGIEVASPGVQLHLWELPLQAPSP